MERKLTCTNYFIILEKKTFKRAHQNPNANDWAHPVITNRAVGYHSPPPPEFQLAFHIYHVKYGNTFTYKRICWNSGGNDVLKYFSISYVYSAKSYHFSPKIKPYIHGNRK